MGEGANELQHDGPDARALVIVEDNDDMRLLIRVNLSRDARLEFDGEADSAEEAIGLARRLQPSVVVLDHLQGPLTGLAAAPLIKAAAPQAKVLLFTAFHLESEATTEPAVGGFLRKDSVARLLATVD